MQVLYLHQSVILLEIQWNRKIISPNFSGYFSSTILKIIF